MQLPKKISPDNIREAVVEVRYDSDVPFELLVGLFVEVFDDTYTYTNRPPQQPIASGTIGNTVRGVNIKIGLTSVVYNDNVSIQLLPNSFVFTWQPQYAGWDEYRKEIATALEQLFSIKKTLIVNRVGLRYISEYPNKDLKDCFKFKFTFGLPEVESETVSFRSEFKKDGTRIILNLSNRVPFVNPNPKPEDATVIRTSIVDIDVICEDVQTTNLPDLLTTVDVNHTKQKEVFFTMIDDNYLQTLNPEY